MSLLKAAAVQLGTSNTASQNFVLSQNVDGTCKLARGNLGATTQDILTVSAGGVVTMPQTITPFSHTVLDDLDAPAWRATLELATIAQAEAEAGIVTTTRTWTAERVKQAIVALALRVGVGQTWQALAGAALATTYTNGSRAIQVAITVGIGNGQSATLVVAGTTVCSAAGPGTGTSYFPISAIIPAGATYIVNHVSATLISWVELK